MGYFENNYDAIRYPIAGVTKEEGLRRTQLGAIYAVASHFTLRNDPAIVVMPTGSGKTVVLMLSAFTQMAKRVLIITPSRLVRHQIVDDFSNLRVLKKIEVIGADVPNPKVYEVIKEINDKNSWNELSEYDVIIGIPKSLSPILENNVEVPSDFFDLILVDEAHHSPAITWEKLLKKFPKAKKVLFTATPFRRDRKEIKGKIVYTYTLSEAYKDKVYGSIQYVPVKTIDGLNNDIAIAKETEKVFNKDKEDGFEHFIMVRTESKKRANELKEIYLKNTKLNLKVINSDYSYKAIKETINKLKNKELDGIICVNMLGEGFDFPNLKIAAIHIPHRSLAITLQFIGRFARTNAEKIGTAKFLAIPSEIQIETAKLYAEGAVWQKIITNLSETKVAEEIEVKETLDKFEFPTKMESETEDLSLYALMPYNHVKIYKVDTDFNLESTISLPSSMSIAFYQVSRELNTIVFITKEIQKPQWTDLKNFEKISYELFVIYFHESTRLLFICASLKLESLYNQIARSFTTTPKKLPLNAINKVLIDLQNPEFFNIGMRNRVLNSNTESYRIIAGSNAQQAIKETDGRLYHRGHIFGRGQNPDGTTSTIGFSSASKVWSNTSSQIPQLIKWCENIAKKISSKKEVKTNSGLDILSSGEIAKEIPEGVIAANWDKDAFFYPMLVKYKMDNNEEQKISLLDIDIEIDRANSDKNKIRVVFKAKGLFYPVEFSLNKDYYFSTVPGHKVNINITRNSLYGQHYIPFLDYLNSKPLNFYFADFSMLCENELFRSKGNKFSLFNTNQIEILDWKAENVDITKEFGILEGGKKSVQELLQEQLEKLDLDIIYYDHGTGEIADFVTVKNTEFNIEFSFYHCKGSGDANPGNRVEDVYEVCGQVVKSVGFAHRNKDLYNKILHRMDLKVEHDPSKTRFIKGTVQLLKEIIEATKTKHSIYKIFVVQPGISRSNLSGKIASVLAAANDYIIGDNCEKLGIIASN